LNLSTDSWTVILSVPYPEITMYGEDLSGMVGLTVAAMAKGRTIIPGLVVTGTITAEGRIGPVGTKPLKLPSIGRGHLRRVIVAQEQLLEERDQSVPGKMQILPIGSVAQAFQELTDLSPKP
jgi:ATP-dependent Lon protease